MPPPTAPLVVLGGRADGHARVVLETARAAGHDVRGFLSDPPHADKIAGVPWLGPIAEWTSHARAGCAFHLGFGSTVGRKRWAETLLAGGAVLVQVVHPRAVVYESARLGPGAFVAALAMLGPNSEVGAAAIVNHGAIVEHDAHVGAWSLVGPGFACGGRARLEEGVMAGVGSRVAPDVVVARWCWLGAGAVVPSNTKPHGLYVGVPARRVRDLGNDAAPAEPRP